MLIARTELGRLPPLQEVAERLFYRRKILDLNQLYTDHINHGTESLPFSQALDLVLLLVG